jgi:hypothetical protein
MIVCGQLVDRWADLYYTILSLPIGTFTILKRKLRGERRDGKRPTHSLHMLHISLMTCKVKAVRVLVIRFHVATVVTALEAHETDQDL